MFIFFNISEHKCDFFDFLIYLKVIQVAFKLIRILIGGFSHQTFLRWASLGLMSAVSGVVQLHT